MSDNTPQQTQPQTQSQSIQNTQNQNQDLENCDLANLESLNVNDSDELLRQLTENTFELETFFSEFSAADIKVSMVVSFRNTEKLSMLKVSHIN